MECMDSSASTLSPKSFNKSKLKDDAPHSHSTDNMYGQAKQNHFANPASNCESLRQSFPYLGTDNDAPAFTTITESREFEEVGPYGFEGETLIKLGETNLTYADIDVGNFGDSLTLGQIPIPNTHESIFELTFPECQVEEKESTANCADFHSAGHGNNSEITCFDLHSDAMDQIPCNNLEHFVPSTDGNLAAGSSAAIMKLRELEEFLLTDIDGNDTTYISNLDSFSLDFNWEENITNIKCSSIPGGGACSGDPHPEFCNGVIRCVLSTEDTEVPCNDDADFTLSSPSRRPVSSRNDYLLRGIIAYHLHLEEKPDSSETIPSKKAVCNAENIEEPPYSSGMIQSNILFELGINLPFIKRGD